MTATTRENLAASHCRSLPVAAQVEPADGDRAAAWQSPDRPRYPRKVSSLRNECASGRSGRSGRESMHG